MLRIGIVGAENSHCAAVARTLNVQKACRARVVAVWGETRRFAEKAAAEGRIPEIVRHPEDMIGKVDGVMIDHRHPRYHVPAAIPFVEAGIPVFVDKPFSWTVAEGWKLVQLARRRRVPLTSFSVIPLQETFRKGFLAQLRKAGRITAVTSIGPCDAKSKYGGVFFYGIHQVDAITKAFGPGIRSVHAIKAARGNRNVVVTMKYGEGGPIVAMHCAAEGKTGFRFVAVGTKATVAHECSYDPNPYLSGVRTFLRMFRTGKEPYSASEILEPIAVLEAIARSLRTGRPATVRRLPC